MTRLGSRHFAATLTPRGIHLIEYRRGVRRLQIVRYAHDLAPLLSPADVAARLGNLLEAQGAEGGRLALALGGFGTYYQIMTLPSAPPEVLRPVVMRELRHVYPDLKDALVEVGRARLDPEARARGARVEREVQLLAAVMPRDVASLLHEALGQRGVALEHVTILPRAVQQVQQAFAARDESFALVLAIPEAPLLGLFNPEGLQYFAAPAGSGGGEEEDEVHALLEQLERGALFVRQQFRGQRLDGMLVVADAAGEPYLRALEAQAVAPVETIGPAGVAPGALAALGVALDARSRTGLNLLPPPMRPPAEADPWVLQTTVVSALLLVLAAGWWGWSGMRAAELLEERVVATASRLQTRAGPLESIQQTVRARQAHHARVALLEPLEQSRTRLQEILWGMEVAPRSIQMDTLRLQQAEERWRGELVGTSSAATSGGATRAIDQWYRGLAVGFPGDAVSLRNLAFEEPDSAEGAGWHPNTVDFRISVSVPLSAESR